MRWCRHKEWSENEIRAIFKRLGVPLKDGTFHAQLGAGDRIRRGGKSHHGDVRTIPGDDVVILERARKAIQQASSVTEQQAREGGNVTAVGTEPPEDLLVDAYTRFTPQQHRVIVRRHNLMSNRFKSWLVQVGAKSISVEAQAVDIACVYSHESYLFELKTSWQQSIRHAMRDALGQALEYSYYPGRKAPEHLAILLDTTPASDDIAWIRQLVAVGIAIELFWLTGDKVYSARVTKNPLARKAILGR